MSERAKRKKRGQNEGSCFPRKDGRWEATLTYTDEFGRRRRKSFYGATADDARDKRDKAKLKLAQGQSIDVKRQTVGQFLEHWLSDVVEPAKAPKTAASYAEIVRLHVIPTLGQHQLEKLNAQHIAALLRQKTDAGLSPRRVHHIRAVLRNALNQAVRWGLIVRNPATLVESPRQHPHEITPFTATEARALLVSAEDDRLAALFRVALTLGLRQGEVLGLHWRDIDLDKGTLRISSALQRINGALILKEPKTEKSRRTLTMPTSVIAALRIHHDRQAFERAAAGADWQETGLVFTTHAGGPLDPRNVIRSWHRIQRHENERRIEQAYRAGNGIPATVDLSKEQAAELKAIQNDPTHPVHAAHALPRRNFHSTRHTAASLLLAEGVPVKVVQEILGHSLLSTTADIYGHLFPTAFKEAAEAMERALAG